jgi:transposase-like protein
MKMARPTIYNEDLAAKILEEYAEGKSVSEICRQEGMPDRVTLWRWRNENKGFATALSHAREANAETIEDEIHDIERKVLAEQVNPQAANVVLSSMRWRARVLHPRRYGDKAEVEHSGNVGLTVNVVRFGDDSPQS